MGIANRTFFTLVNYKSGEKYTCSWDESDHFKMFYDQKIYYVGLTGLGGYQNMLSKGFEDRRFIRYKYESKFKKRLYEKIGIERILNSFKKEEDRTYRYWNIYKQNILHLNLQV